MSENSISSSPDSIFLSICILSISSPVVSKVQLYFFWLSNLFSTNLHTDFVETFSCKLLSLFEYRIYVLIINSFEYTVCLMYAK